MSVLFGGLLAAQTETSQSNAVNWLLDVDSFGLRRTTSGVNITHDIALTLPAYFAVVHVIARDVAKVPMKAHREIGEGRETVRDHIVTQLFKLGPTPWGLAISFKEAMTAWALTWGGGVAEIERDGRGKPVALHPIHPSRIHIERLESGEPVYHVLNNDGTRITLNYRDVFHLRGFSRDGVEGYSLIHLAGESVGLGLAAQTFGSAFFGNGAHVGSIIERADGAGTLSNEALATFRQTWSEMHRGVNKAGGFAILPPGMKHQTLSIPPEHAQFIESRRFTVEEMCRWVGVAPNKVQHWDKASYNNFEQANVSHVDDALLPWFMRWEQEANVKLFDAVEQRDHYARHNTKALKAGDMLARKEFYTGMFYMGALTPNEIRALEEMNSLGPEGDRTYVQTNTIPTSAVGMNTQPGASAVNRASVIESQAHIFSALLKSEATEERKYIERMAKKHKADRGAFAAVIGDYFAERRAHLCDLLRPAAGATADLLRMADGRKLEPEDVSRLESALAVFANMLCAKRHDAALRAFDSGEPMERWADNEDAGTEAARAIGLAA